MVRYYVYVMGDLSLSLFLSQSLVLLYSTSSSFPSALLFIGLKSRPSGRLDSSPSGF